MNDLEFVTKISGMLLSELDIPLESQISFFDNSGKLIASSGEDELLNQRINVNCPGYCLLWPVGMIFHIRTTLSTCSRQ